MRLTDIYDSDLKRVAVYARVSTSSEEQISSIENQTLYYTKKIAETENWNLQDIYSDEGKSGTSLRKRDAFKRMMRDAKDQKMDLIISLREGMKLRKTQLSYRLKKMNGNGSQGGKNLEYRCCYIGILC